MKLSLRSRLLILLGTHIYGEPRAWGLNCSASEFYAMPNERPQLSPKFLHPRVAQEWEVMRRNVLVDRVRQRVFKHLAIAACVASLAVFTSGSLAIKGINKTKEFASSVKSKIDTSSTKEEQRQALQKQATDLTAQANAHTITKDEYEARAKEIQQQYEALN